MNQIEQIPDMSACIGGPAVFYIICSQASLKGNVKNEHFLLQPACAFFCAASTGGPTKLASRLNVALAGGSILPKRRGRADA